MVQTQCLAKEVEFNYGYDYTHLVLCTCIVDVTNSNYKNSAADEHREVKRVLGTLLTIWKSFYYSPRKAEKLAEIQAVLNAPEIKMVKPSDTRWLSRERAMRAVRRSLPALVNTFEEIYSETGDAEAHGIAILLTKYSTVACIYMLSETMHVHSTR